MTYPFITIPADQPCYEEVVEMTMEQRRALPARFHTPQWMDSSPGLFMCRVCWDGEEMTVTEWPCPSAVAGGRDVFGPERQIR